MIMSIWVAFLANRLGELSAWALIGDGVNGDLAPYSYIIVAGAVIEALVSTGGRQDG